MDRFHFYALGGALGGLLVLTIFIVYDRQQKRDPHYRRKLRLKREYERKLSEIDRLPVSPLDIVESRKEEDVIILHELQIGEALMVRGNIEEATQHFANAISVCSNPEKFLRTLKSCLDPSVYNMLLNTLVKGNLNHAYPSKMYLNENTQHYSLLRCEKSY
ncbi:MAS20 protein import receptor [Popillia japonica]|uniref:MAS20 protein import receptor n=1 Tax=Popillia japonica TaxID=7064 RepID=A0AAW1MLB3_POPJA